MRPTSISSRHQEKQDQGHTQVELRAQIRSRAYQLYEQRGRKDGDDLGDWLKAEEEVLEGKYHRAA